MIIYIFKLCENFLQMKFWKSWILGSKLIELLSSKNFDLKFIFYNISGFCYILCNKIVVQIITYNIENIILLESN